MQKTEPQIRIAIQDDVPAITEIYNQAVHMKSATADMAHISIENRRKWLEHHTPVKYPVFVDAHQGTVRGYCSLSPYRPGRMALRYTAEISYYIHENYRRQGIGFRLVSNAVKQCPRLRVKTLFAIILDINAGSVKLLEKCGFEKWGHMPDVADFDGKECGHYYYGLRVIP